jgi:hypothetical protein
VNSARFWLFWRVCCWTRVQQWALSSFFLVIVFIFFSENLVIVSLQEFDEYLLCHLRRVEPRRQWSWYSHAKSSTRNRPQFPLSELHDSNRDGSECRTDELHISIPHKNFQVSRRLTDVMLKASDTANSSYDDHGLLNQYASYAMAWSLPSPAQLGPCGDATIVT